MWASDSILLVIHQESYKNLILSTVRLIFFQSPLIIYDLFYSFRLKNL